MSILSDLRDSYRRRVGTVDPLTGTHRATPWVERTDTGIYTGINRQVWLYRVLDNIPLRFEDGRALLDHGRAISTLLSDIGRSSIATPPGFSRAPEGFYRNIHVLTVRWYERPTPPDGTPNAELADYIDRELLTFDAPAQAVFIGVQLRDLDANAVTRATSTLEFAISVINDLFRDNPTDHDIYARDADYVHTLLERHGCRIPRPDETRQLEAWFNHGSHAEPEIIRHPDHLIVNREDRIEFVVAHQFNQPIFHAPHREWLADTLDHPDGPNVVSIRAELQPAPDTRKALRKSIRARRHDEAERAAANADPRAEEDEEAELTQLAEQQYSHADAHPTLRRVSLIFGRRHDQDIPGESYTDQLRNNYGIETRPLIHRQLWALEETMPCAQKRAADHPHHLSLEMVSYAGVGQFSSLGDPQGAFVGRALPDGTPVYFDPLEASRRNLPPATFVSGIPGGGKLLTLGTQIPTPGGWTTMGALKVGDEVLGRDGRPCRVTFVSDVEPEPQLFDVHFDDGQVIRACVDHQWVVTTRDGRRNARGVRRAAAIARWDRTNATADALDLLAARFGPDDDVSTTELLALLRRDVPDAPWLTHVSVHEALRTVGCVPHEAERKAGIEPRPGMVTVSTSGQGEYLQTKAREVWPAAVALKSLAGLLRDQAGERPTANPAERVITVGRMLTEGIVSSDGGNRFAVPVAAPLNLPPADLPVAPYLLGAWLGDGCSREGVICGIDRHIFDRAAASSGRKAHVRRDPRDGRHPDHRMVRYEGLTTALRGLGVLGGKHIPGVYLRGSYEQRLELLQGLMDTDGTIDENGSSSLTLCDERLVGDALDLIRSLGIKASMTTSPAALTEPDPDQPGQTRRRVMGTRYRIQFTTDTPVFTLPRKADRLPTQVRQTQQWLHITDVVPAPSEPGRCITVDAPDHLYLAGQYVPTHNTFLSLHLSYQFALGGLQVGFVNPKGMDSLRPMVDFMARQGIETEWVSISRLMESGGEGTFDPFRYAQTPETAAMLASNLLTTVLDFDQPQRNSLRQGLVRAAKAGARSTGQALQSVTDAYVVDQVMALWESTPMFALAVGMEPKPTLRPEGPGGTGRFVLTEFDVGMDLPTQVKEKYTDAERIALAAVRAVTTAQVGMMAGTTGGVLVIDEAHAVLGHPDTVHLIQKLMREGRSMNVAQVYISQLVSDLVRVGEVGSSLESYISRWFVLKHTDDHEAAAGLQAVGYEPTPQRVAQLRTFGPRKTEQGTQPAFAYMRDLDGRKTIVSLGPVGREFAKAASTNIDDRIARERLQALGEREREL